MHGGGQRAVDGAVCDPGCPNLADGEGANSQGRSGRRGCLIQSLIAAPEVLFARFKNNQGKPSFCEGPFALVVYPPAFPGIAVRFTRKIAIAYENIPKSSPICLSDIFQFRLQTYLLIFEH